MRSGPDPQIFSDELVIDGSGRSPFVVGAGWLIEIIDVESGELFFLSNGEEVRPTGARFGVFYPPFSIVCLCVEDVRGRVRGIGAFGDVPPGLSAEPVIFETEFEGEVRDAGHAADILIGGSDRRYISINTRPSRISLRAKKLIDENYRIYPSIGRIAARLGISHEHLARQFKRDYGMSPSAYLHQIRVAEATYKLSGSEEIIDISMEVGYNDLSRFYKQFRKSTGTSPGDCRVQLKR
jgi:AraC-like DNA-binding protein